MFNRTSSQNVTDLLLGKRADIDLAARDLGSGLSPGTIVDALFWSDERELSAVLGGTWDFFTTTSDTPFGAAEAGGEVSRVTVDDTSSIVVKLRRLLSFGAGFRGEVLLFSSEFCFLFVVNLSDFFFGRIISRVSETDCQNVRSNMEKTYN